MQPVTILILVAGAMFIVIGGLSLLSHLYTLSSIKSRTVGDGQHGTARFANNQEILSTYTHVAFKPQEWRQGIELPKAQGIILGSKGPKGNVTALVDEGDVHALMIAASGAGKTAYFLYPNIEYACATGMSFLCTDTKGDLFRNYAGIAQKYYGYNVAVIDLRNPTSSDGFNMLHLVNRYMDIYREDNTNIAAKAKAEKYAKIISKTIINSSGDSASFGQNAFFYDSAEGLLTASILLVAEYLPRNTDAYGHPIEVRHIISVYKLIQDLLAPSKTPQMRGQPQKSQFQELMDKLPGEHKARWFAGAALNSSDQAMASVMSTALSRLNAFLDTEMEQVLCFDTAVDAEKFCSEKSAIFVILPEEDLTKYFLVSLFIQQMYREILSVADEQGGKLARRVVFYCDELGTIPPIDSLELIFSASRSRRMMLVPIVQSFAQLRKNYGSEGSEIIIDNCQDIIFGGFAPSSESAKVLSDAMGSRTIMSGSISRGKNDPSQTLQMMERPLMTPDELKSMPRGDFIVMKTGTHPMQTHLRLFLDWGIQFEKEYVVTQRAARVVHYAQKEQLEQAITADEVCYVDPSELAEDEYSSRGSAGTGTTHTPEVRKRDERRRHSAGINIENK